MELALELIDEALESPPEAGAALAGTRIESLDQPVDEDAGAAWEEEITARRLEMDAKSVKQLSRMEARRILAG